MRGMKLAKWLCVVLAASGYLHAAEGDSSHEIPLSSITSTSHQSGLQQPEQAHLGDSEATKAGKPSYYLEQIYIKTSGVGASNVFLVDAPDFREAVSATSRVLIGASAADRPATLNEPNPPRGNYWLVAYLGVASSTPPQWLVDSATVESTKIRFAYHHRDSGAVTMDIHQYLYWVPLKTLPPGTYQLELFDTGTSAVTLSRRVVVEK
jgi:hypothetical protein